MVYHTCGGFRWLVPIESLFYLGRNRIRAYGFTLNVGVS